MKMGLFVPSVGRQYGGPETYERHLVESLGFCDPSVEFHIFCFSQSAIDSFGETPSNVTFHQLRPGSRWVSLPLGLPLSLKRRGVDLYHATLIPAPVSLTPFVFTMHDVTPFTHPEFYPAAIRRRLNPSIERGLKQARSIICISEHCRQTTAEHFGVPLERMHVIHHGINPALAPAGKDDARGLVKKEYDLHDEFVFYVGKLEARKNIVRLIEAFSRMVAETDFKGDLVLAGKRYWDLDGIDEAVQKFGMENRVRELGFVPDAHLASLFSACEFFVFPSLWEGFGFPVLEAMACGAPVVTSTVSSLPEIAGDGAVLVDPHSTDAIAAGMAEMVKSSDFRDEMRQRGLKQSAEFTWERTARETLAVYKDTYDKL
jgi:glycosyltransferase involved in cell wall biosynthesis